MNSAIILSSRTEFEKISTRSSVEFATGHGTNLCYLDLRFAMLEAVIRAAVLSVSRKRRHMFQLTIHLPQFFGSLRHTSIVIDQQGYRAHRVASMMLCIFVS